VSLHENDELMMIKFKISPRLPYDFILLSIAHEWVDDAIRGKRDSRIVCGEGFFMYVEWKM
jgi:hypothetical protein